MNSSKKRHSKKGVAAVEFAIAIPVFVLILLGTIESCTMIFLKQSLEIAAYEAARVSLIPKSTTSDVESAATALLSVRRINNFTISVTPSNFQTASYGTFIRVDVSAPCNSNSAFLPIFSNSRTLIGSVEMMKEF